MFSHSYQFCGHIWPHTVITAGDVSVGNKEPEDS